MYDKDGNLKPIEINTSIGWNMNKFEENENTLDLTDLKNFVELKQFNKVCFIGNLPFVSTKLKEMCDNLSIDFNEIKTDINSITIPMVEDNDETLIIRSSYDGTALVDDTYCRSKVEFLKLIQNTNFSSQFAYLDENGVLVNNITTINDNGSHPNFLLKSIYPEYDKDVYPKFFKVTTQQELDVILQNVNENYFLMEFHFNQNETYLNHMKVIRSFNLLYPPTLESISIGAYTTFCNGDITELPTIDSETFEVITYRNNYTSVDKVINKAKLENDDLVQMEDGSFMVANDLKVGDFVKTIDIGGFNDIDYTQAQNFKINLEQLQSTTTYSSNKVLGKQRLLVYTHTKIITFTDGTTWKDSEGSIYLSYRNDEVRFLSLGENLSEEFRLNVGDSVILLDTLNETTPNFVMKEVQSIDRVSGFFGGWIITVEREHLFLTKSTESNSSFVAIEQNGIACPQTPSYSCYNWSPCVNVHGKGWVCCGLDGTCEPSCGNCPTQS
jgi:hypothetical protein